MAGYLMSGCDNVCAYVNCYSYTQILFFILQPYLKCLYTDCRCKVIKYCLLFICVAAGICRNSSIRT